MSLKLVKMNEIKKNKWFKQAQQLKTIIPERYMYNSTMQTTPLHIDDREHCAYIDLSTPKHPVAVQEKI